jgi:hypothetical protein
MTKSNKTVTKKSIDAFAIPGKRSETKKLNLISNSTHEKKIHFTISLL